MPDATVQIVMPAMGDSVAEGTVLEWRKQEGDSVEADETLVEISTDKVDAEVPSPTAGTIVKIHAAVGDTVPVGALLAEISPDGGSADRAAAAPGTAGAPAERPGVAPDTPGAPVAHSTSVRAPVGETIDIVTPSGGESVTEGTILTWSVKVGDPVDEGDTVVEISTDKVDMELPAPASGTITEILAQEGETVTVGQVIARMTGGAPTTGRVAEAPAPVPVVPAEPAPAAALAEPAEPVASAVAKPAPAAQPLRGAAATLARYMDQSRQLPTATSFRTLTVTELELRRVQLKEAGVVSPIRT